MPSRSLIAAGMAVVIAGVVALAFGWQPAIGFEGVPTVVFVVRHAEKDSTGTEDPPLSQIGRRRAEQLATIAGLAEISVMFTSQFRRTRETAAPLARKRELVPVTVPAGDLEGLARAIKSRQGENILVVAHSNTIPQIISKIGGVGIASIQDDQYGDLFVVVIPRWAAPRVIHLQYGESQ